MKKIYYCALLTAGLTFAVSHPVLAEEPDSDAALAKLQRHIQFSGAVEIEAGWSEDFDGTRESDIALATAELGVEAQLVDWATGSMLLSWDDEEDKVTVDEAYVLLGDEEKFPLSLQAGRFYLPFGVFEANTISDPLTLEAFEIREDAVMASYTSGGFATGVYVFNGDTNEDGGDDTIEHFGGYVSYQHEIENFSFSTSSGYLSSVMDSDTLSESADLEADYVDGLFVQAMLTLYDISLSGEYITALADYEPAEGTVRRPASFHLEAGYAFNPGLPLQLALSYSQTDELAEILPKSRLAAALGVEWGEGVSTTVEYCRDTDYETSDGGTDEEADIVTIQLAYAF